MKMNQIYILILIRVRPIYWFAVIVDESVTHPLAFLRFQTKCTVFQRMNRLTQTSSNSKSHLAASTCGLRSFVDFLQTRYIFDSKAGQMAAPCMMYWVVNQTNRQFHPSETIRQVAAKLLCQLLPLNKCLGEQKACWKAVLWDLFKASEILGFISICISQ